VEYNVYDIISDDFSNLYGIYFLACGKDGDTHSSISFEDWAGQVHGLKSWWAVIQMTDLSQTNLVLHAEFACSDWCKYISDGEMCRWQPHLCLALPSQRFEIQTFIQSYSPCTQTRRPVLHYLVIGHAWIKTQWRRLMSITGHFLRKYQSHERTYFGTRRCKIRRHYRSRMIGFATISLAKA